VPGDLRPCDGREAAEEAGNQQREPAPAPCREHLEDPAELQDRGRIHDDVQEPDVQEDCRDEAFPLVSAQHGVGVERARDVVAVVRQRAGAERAAAFRVDPVSGEDRPAVRDPHDPDEGRGRRKRPSQREGGMIVAVHGGARV
jgi:hypothetical protein